MAITYFGSFSNPADNGSQAGPGPISATPPASMLAGDIVSMKVQVRTSSVSDSLIPNEMGGQVWQRIKNAPQTNCSCALWACQFNGTWSADPSFENTNANTTPLTIKGDVYRPAAGKRIDLELMLLPVDAGTFNNTGTTKTITGKTTQSTVTMVEAIWFTSDDITWGTLTGTVGTWTVAGTAQYRNTSGSDQSLTVAYQAFGTAGVTGTISQTQSIATAGSTLIVIWREIDDPTLTTAPTVQVFTDFENSTNGTAVTTTILTNGTHSGGETWTWAMNNPTDPFYFVATAAEVALAGSLIQNGTTYADAGATRGFNMDFAQCLVTSTAYFELARSAAVSKISASIVFSCNFAQGFSSFTVFGITCGSATGLIALNLGTFAATSVQTNIENPNSALNIGPDIVPQLTSFYRCSLLYDDTNNLGAMAFHDMSNHQVGFTVMLKPENTNPDAPSLVRIGQFGGGLGQTLPATNIYMDDLMINTSGVFPLLPGTPSAAFLPRFNKPVLQAVKRSNAF